MKTLVLLAGAALVAIALFAYPLGLDNNPVPGAKRQWLALAGLALTLSVPGHVLVGRLVNSAPGRSLTVRLRAWRIWGVLRAVWVDAALALTAALVLLAGWWVTTAGTFTALDYQSHYYDMLADGFRQGQVSLLVQPPAQLAGLSNPYERSQREGIDYLWDASYYNGKYYLYWGPLPALLALPLKLAGAAAVPDQDLCYLFLAFTYLFQVLIMRRLWRRFFADITGWSLIAGALLAGLSHPLFFILNRPVIYEAAVSGGQCFLMAGLYLVIRSLTTRPPGQDIQAGGLAAAGACLAAAVACRVSLALPVSALAALVLLYLAGAGSTRPDARPPLWRPALRERIQRALPLWSALLLPLVLGAAALIAYNVMRFNDPLEFGFHYVLTTRNQNDNRVLISTAYILPNIYTFFLRLPTFQPEFPFILAEETNWPAWMAYPPNYAGYEPTAGLLALGPAAWFALAAAGFTLRHWRRLRPAEGETSLQWTYLWLLGCLLAAVGQSLFFFYSTTRYQQDFAPLLYLAALCGVWGMLRTLRRKAGAQKVVLGLFFAGVILASCSGFLLGFSEPYARTLRQGFTARMAASLETVLAPLVNILRRAMTRFF